MREDSRNYKYVHNTACTHKFLINFTTYIDYVYVCVCSPFVCLQMKITKRHEKEVQELKVDKSM